MIVICKIFYISHGTREKKKNNISNPTLQKITVRKDSPDLMSGHRYGEHKERQYHCCECFRKIRCALEKMDSRFTTLQDDTSCGFYDFDPCDKEDLTTVVNKG